MLFQLNTVTKLRLFWYRVKSNALARISCNANIVSLCTLPLARGSYVAGSTQLPPGEEFRACMYLWRSKFFPFLD